MAKVAFLTVADVNIINTSGKIDWSKFKNTPASIVSAAGHNHDGTHYTTEETNTLFSARETTLTNIESQISLLAIKEKGFMGGGGSQGTNVNEYNTVTQTSSAKGSILSHSPSTKPGITSSTRGYFTNGTTTTRYVYLDGTAQNISSSPISINGTLIDFAIQTKGFVTDGGTQWAMLTVDGESWETKPSTTAASAGRNMLSSTTTGISKAGGTSTAVKYTYSTGASVGTASFTTSSNTTGLNRNSQYGYWIGEASKNVKYSYTTDTAVTLAIFSSNFVNTNTVTAESYGFVISGSNSTSAQKVDWTTEVASTATNASVDMTGASTIEG
jgi:hypothetical protein